ncbi:ATP-dependent RNA helicase DDX24 [Cyclospora cayetanensis]|uniref:ATP-dependent RNA helicase n=1 Tax=Cyclospora cayetanensis TaxID=88456 RepID=A0A6P6S0R3_9EIME|nr:ATP-dependent RNA helicase DDX24 [Cyclospora cayetanensis]
MKAKKAKKASSEGLGQAEGAPRGLPLWRAVDVEPGLEAEGFLGLEELVYEEEAKPRGEKRKRDRSQQRGQAEAAAAAAAAASPEAAAAAAAAAAFDCMYDSYELVPQLDEGLDLWKPHLNNDICMVHPAVSRVLLQQQLVRPTPVQQQVLLQALRDRRDVVATAQTGSGKTLAFALPIVSSLATQLARRLEKWQERQTRKEAEEQQERATAEAFLEHHEGGPEADPAVREEQRRQFLLQQVQPEGPAALVLEPTRELALQVLHVLQQLCTYTPIRAAAVVGGLSPEKQLRVLGTSKPLILVATPGRLLALQREQPLSVAASEAASEALGVGKVDDQGEDEEEENEDPQNQVHEAQMRRQQGRRERLAAQGLSFSQNFSMLQFLVLDEADRLLQQQQQRGKQNKEKKKKKKKQNRPWIPPSTETEVLLQLVYAQLDAAPPKGCSSNTNKGSSDKEMATGSNRSKRKKQQKQPKMPRQLKGRAASLQTFVLSATLALALQRKQQGLQVISASSQDDEDGSAAAAALLQHVRIRAKMLVAVRVSEAEQQQHVWRHQLQEQEPQTEGQKESAVELQQLNSKLPSTLRLSVWKCPVESEMEVHLAAYLLRVFDLKAGEKQPLRVVLFVNAISYVYRLESLLTFLSSRYGLLVSTDVAARGVDFKDVEKVLHFQRPRDQETFIHRCGRTARAGKDGEAVCFISSSASGVWEWLLASAGIQLSAAPPPLGFRDIAGLQERMETIRRLFQLADQVERENHQEQKQKRKRGVMRRLALAADVELESDGSAADEALQDLRIKGQRKNQQARQKLRQASVFTDSAQAIEVDVQSSRREWRCMWISLPFSCSSSSDACVPQILATCVP